MCPSSSISISISIRFFCFEEVPVWVPVSDMRFGQGICRLHVPDVAFLALVALYIFLAVLTILPWLAHQKRRVES